MKIIKQAIHIKNIIARSKTRNNKSILLTKRFSYALPENASQWKSYHRETSQSISVLNQLTGFQLMQSTTEGNYAGNHTN